VSGGSVVRIFVYQEEYINDKTHSGSFSQILLVRSRLESSTMASIHVFNYYKVPPEIAASNTLFILTLGPKRNPDTSD